MTIYSNRLETIETVYTYDEWLKEYRKREALKKLRRRSIYRYFFCQWLLGMVFIIIGVITIYILGDGTTAIFIIPLGFYLIFTKKRLIMF